MADGNGSSVVDRHIRVAVVMTDDQRVRRVCSALAGPEIDVVRAGGIDDVRHDFSGGTVDLVVTDQLSPEGAIGDGVLGVIGLPMPPVVVVAPNRVVGVESLEAGAADYVVEPFAARELRARALIRASVASASASDFGELRVDHASRRVSVRGADVELTPREYDLLAFLAARPGRVFTRQELLEAVWAASTGWQSPSTVTEHVYRLRRKIEENLRRPRWIVTVRGAGYRFDP